LVTLQNGLGNIEAIKDATGSNSEAWKGRLLAGTTSQGARLEALGIVRDTGVGMNYVGAVEDSGSSALVAELEKMFHAAGLPYTSAPTPASTLSAIYTKATINAALNPMAAVTRLPNGLCGAPGSETLEIMTSTALECALIAKAHGIELSTDRGFWMERLQSVCKATAGNTNSMLVDVLKKRRTEVNEINGALCRLAKEKNLDCTRNGIWKGLVGTMEGEYEKRVSEG
jgi:2-dehydropantoate 2-reductase